MNLDYSDLTVRRASLSDSESLLIWRNDPMTIKFSLSNDPVTREQHKLWINRELKDKCCLLLIGEISGIPVGMVRINMLDESRIGQVSINLNPDFRGKGISRTLLNKSLATGNATFKQVLRYFADIHISNVPSQRIFQSLGFVKISLTPSTNFESYVLDSNLVETSY